MNFKSIVVVGPQHPDTLPKSVFEALKDMSYNVNAVDEREMLGISHRKDIGSRGRLGFFTKLKSFVINNLIRLSPKFEARVYNRLARIVESYEPDLIITHSAWIPPQAIARLKKNTKAKIVSWFPDHPGNFGRQYLLAAPYDFLFFKDKWLVDLARRVKRNAYYLPEACMPKWHKRVELSEDEKEKYGCDVTTAGNMYYYRVIIFEELMKYFKVKLWGAGIPRWIDSPIKNVYQGGVVAELEKSKAFNAAKVVVNTFQGEVFGVNQRFFEIAGCGGFQICEEREEVGDFFKIGEEIVTFSDIDDLKNKISYYLVHEEERKKISDAAYARAQKEHTFQKRLEKMFQVISG